jgi:hypothetical protein
MKPSVEFIDEIRRGQAAQAADAILLGHADGDAAMARAVRDACTAISRRMVATRADILAACEKAGVAARAETGPEDRDALQFHTTSIRLPPSGLATVLEVAEGFGFRPPFSLRPGQVEAIGRYVSELTLLRDEGVTSRIVLRIDRRGVGLPSALYPRLADIAVRDVRPGRTWIYPLLRLRRIVGERLSGRRAPTSDSDYLGTPDSLIFPLLDSLEPGPQDVLFDLGCGDGRVVVAAATRYGCRSVGIEPNPDLVAAARDRAASAGPDTESRIEILEGFAENADLSDATIVFMFLPPSLLARFFETVVRRAAPGVRILAHEQLGLPGVPDPSESRAIVGVEAITVAHLWRT